MVTMQRLTQDTYYNPQTQAQIDKQAKDTKGDKEGKDWEARLARRNLAKSVGESVGEGVGEGEQQEMSIEDIMDIVAFLWHQSQASRPPMQQGPSEEDVSREKVEAWLQTR